MERKKKLKVLMWLIVTFVILDLSLIITGIPGKICGMVTGLSCVATPINEVVNAMQRAQAGLIIPTSSICMSGGSSFTSTFITNKLSNVDSVSFECDTGYCQNPLQVTRDRLAVSGDSMILYKIFVSCEKNANERYDCILKPSLESVGYPGEADCNNTFLSLLFVPLILLVIAYFLFLKKRK